MSGRVFILGAGFSNALSSAMPPMVDLSHAVRDQLETLHRPLPEESVAFGDDIERLLSYLAESQPWLDEPTNLRNRAAFADVSLAVARVIREREFAAVQNAPPPWLQTLIRYWIRMESTVITFNYDTLVEASALTELGTTAAWSELYRAPVVPAGHRTAAVLGGSGPAPMALLKLHGSVNWYWSGLDSIPSDAIYDVGVRGGWSVAGVLPRYDEQLVADKLPMVVPPAATKSRFYDNRVLGAQWSEAARALTEADELVTIGYSLPSSDLVVRSLLITTFRGITVLPVDHSDAVTRNLEELFGDRVEPAFAGQKDAIPDFVRATCT